LTSVRLYNVTAPTDLYTLSLHDALPISGHGLLRSSDRVLVDVELEPLLPRQLAAKAAQLAAQVVQQRLLELEAPHVRLHLLRVRSEEHTSELQSREKLVCRLLLEKTKTL